MNSFLEHFANSIPAEPDENGLGLVMGRMQSDYRPSRIVVSPKPKRPGNDLEMTWKRPYKSGYFDRYVKPKVIFDPEVMGDHFCNHFYLVAFFVLEPRTPRPILGHFDHFKIIV